MTAQSFTTWTLPAPPRTSTRSPTKRNGTLYWRPSKATRASIPDHPDRDHIEGLRQGLGQARQAPFLARPGLGHARARCRTDAFVSQSVEPRIRPLLEFGQIGQGRPAGIKRKALIEHAALDLALGARLARRTGINMEMQNRRVASVGRIDGPPRARTAGHRGLLVVDAYRRRHAPKPGKASDLAPQPGQHVLGLGPDDRRLAAPRQDHVQRHEIPGEAAHHDSRKMSPVHLRLSVGRGLDPAPGPKGWSRIGAGPVTLDGAQAAGIAML